MNLVTLLCSTLALVALTPQPSSIGTEAVTLAWKLQEDAEYLVKSSSVIETSTVTMGQDQAQDTTLATTHLVHVDEVTEEGNMRLTITVQAYSMSQESDQLSMELVGVRDDDGDISVTVQLDSPVEELLGGDIEELFEAIGRNSMEVEFKMLLTPRGKVIESSLEGDPMGNLPAETDITRMIAETAGAMLDIDDLAGALAATMFSLLPEDSVEVGDDWSIARHYSVAGLDMDGEGSCTLDELKGEGADRLAILTEDMDYEVDASQLCENMQEMMSIMFESMGMEMDVSIDLDADDMNAVLHSEFDIEAGFNRSMTWSDMIANVGGSMGMGDMDMELDVETITSGESSWERVESK